MQLKNNYVVREIMGETILVPVGDHLLEFNGLITLNELGVFILKALPEAEDEDQIVDRILEEYDVDRATAKADVSEFLDKLREISIL
ncbi:MAG: PqqD family protein [Clostridia bacterium]|nr:PqqD family protein [Clostridia bacterium]